MGALGSCGIGQPSCGEKLCREILNNTYLNYITVEKFEKYLAVLENDINSITEKEIDSSTTSEKVRSVCIDFCLSLILGKRAEGELKEKFENNKFKDIHALLIPDFESIPDFNQKYISYIFCWAFSFLKPNVILTKHESLYKHILKQFHKVDLIHTKKFVNLYIAFNVEVFPIRIIKYIILNFEKHEKSSGTNKDLVLFGDCIINQDIIDDLKSKLSSSFSHLHAFSLYEKLLSEHDECIVDNNNTEDIHSFNSFEDYLMIDNVIVWCFNEYKENIGRVANTSMMGFK